MKAQFFVFIFVIGTLFVYCEDNNNKNDQPINTKGLVQAYADGLLANVKDTRAAIHGNDAVVKQVFTYFKTVHSRVYKSPDEHRKRLAIFKQHLLNITAINSDLSLPYDAEVNEFSDMTAEEFNSQKKGLDTSEKKRKKRDGSVFETVNPIADTSVSTASSLDWVTKGYVTAVKDQQQCGSCYAFATMAVLESAWAIKKGQLISFSPQELTDCSTKQGNYGCNGGNFVPSITCLNSIGRTSTWTGYPYTGVQGSCRTSSNTVSNTYQLGKIQYTQIPSGDENSLLAALNLGPVWIGINADTSTFMYYKSGVINLSASSCSPSGIDHAVTLVGYGTDARTGLNYWKIKNSWGTNWGEAGYVRMARGINICGIANMAYRPILS